jgi:hypothetical protein
MFACSAPATRRRDARIAGVDVDVVDGSSRAAREHAAVAPYNKGATVSFKISTPANAYHLDIYRLGYYQGNGARLIASVNPSVSLPQSQHGCQADLSVGLVDCGSWAVSATWAIPATAVSGIYIAKAIRTDTGGASHLVFIVRDDSSTIATVVPDIGHHVAGL